MSELRKSKYNYGKYLATRIKTDSKLFWSHVRAKTKTKSTIVALKSGDDTQLHVIKKEQNILNTYFASVFTVENSENLPSFEDSNYVQPLVDTAITSEKVSKSINALNQPNPKD